jgi:hypothetical protein
VRGTLSADGVAIAIAINRLGSSGEGAVQWRVERPATGSTNDDAQGSVDPRANRENLTNDEARRGVDPRRADPVNPTGQRGIDS